MGAQFESHPPHRRAASAEETPEYLLQGHEELGNFQPLATGAYSRVWAAESAHLRRRVAVKIERRQLTDARQRDRFHHTMAQARVVSQHPCIIPIYSAGVANGGHPYVIMELCPTNAAQALRTVGPLDPSAVLKLGIRVADALVEIHSQGLVHGDVKPANILVNENREALLTDLGFATDNPDGSTGPVSVTATPAFAAREVFEHGQITSAADVYSLAASLYTLLNGTPPRFPEQGVSDINEVQALFSQPIPNIPGVSPLLTEMLKTGLIDNPAGRPTAEYFRDSLSSIPEESTGVLPVVETSQQFLSPPLQGTFSAFASAPAPIDNQPDAELAPQDGHGANVDQTHLIPTLHNGHQSAADVEEEADTERLPLPRKQYGEPSPQAAAPWGDVPGNMAVPPETPNSGLQQETPGPDVVDVQLNELDRRAVNEHDDRLPAPLAEKSVSPTDTGGITRRERRLRERGGSTSDMGRLIGLVTVGVLVLAGLGVGGYFLFRSEPTRDLEKESQAEDYVAECTLTADGASCVEEPVCFDGDPGDGFSPVSCDASHQWEAYAQGPLPEGVTDMAEAQSNDLIQGLCIDGQREDGPLQELVGAERIDWTTAVHLPDNGTFQCIAGNAEGENVTGSQFSRANSD
ncbi:serine/threonine-protein kinase [Haloglycomyces albus]|uniref:serine/threonine-protein kinase n=1 Tax=Haloglycomyces albus TaxID=526067 RepID=UPI00146F9547|nr:serine/threonine-protein kinase [Haloglycomyces albus]